MVWDPSRVDPTPWPNVLEFYRGIAGRNDDFRPLHQLVEHVISEGYESSIFCATSGTSLFIARQPQGNWGRDSLRIDVDLSGTIRFVHRDSRLAGARHFTCAGGSIVRAFEQFLVKARWLVDAAAGLTR